MTEIDLATRIQELERRGFGQDPRVQRMREDLQDQQAESRAVPDTLQPRVGLAEWDNDGSMFGGSVAVRRGNDGTEYDAHYALDQSPEAYAKRSIIETIAAEADRFTTLEGNKSRREAWQGDYGALGQFGARTMDIVDAMSGAADTASFEVSDDIMEAAGFPEAAERRRQMTEQTITGGGLNTAAAVGGMLAPIGVVAGAPATAERAATGLARIPGLRGAGTGAQMARGALAATATAEAGITGAGNFDPEAIGHLNEIDVTALPNAMGADMDEIGIPMGAVAPALGLLGPAIGPVFSAIGRRGGRFAERYTNPARSAARHVYDAIDAGGQGIDDVRQMRNRAGGSLRALDVNEQTRRLGGSANRLGTSQELQNFATERRDARPGRMVQDFQDQAVADPLRARLDREIQQLERVETVLGPRIADIDAKIARVQSAGPGADVAKAVEKLTDKRRRLQARINKAQSIAEDTQAQLERAERTTPETIIDETMQLGDDLIARRSDVGGERGYSQIRQDGLRFSTDPVPNNAEWRPPTRDYPTNRSFADEAMDVEDIARERGYAREAELGELERTGVRTDGGLTPVPRDDLLLQYGTNDLKASLQARGLPVEQMDGRKLTNADRVKMLQQAREAEAGAGGGANRVPPSVTRMRGIKTAANDAAQSARQAGEMGRADSAGAFASRVRRLLETGIKNAAGHRVSFIPDRYHAALSRAVEMLELASGVDARSGAGSGVGFFQAKPEQLQRAMDDLRRARASIAADTSMSTEVRGNILRELDRSFDAYRQGAVRSYLKFVESSPVGRDARVFNTERRDMVRRLRTLFDSEEDLQAFLRSVDDEYIGQQGERAVMPRSDTPERRAQDEALRESTGATADGRSPDILNSLRGGINAVIFDFVGARMRNASDRLVRGVTSRVADEIARMLSSADLEAIARELETVRASGRTPTIANLPPNVRRALVNATRQGRHNGQPRILNSRERAEPSRDIGSPAQDDYPSRTPYERGPVSRQRPGLHAERTGRAQSLRDAGSGYVDIAERMGVNPPVAWALVNGEAATSLRGVKNFSPDQLRDMVDGGLKLSEILKIIGGPGGAAARMTKLINALGELQITPKDVAAKSAEARRLAGEVKRLPDAQVETAANRRAAGESYVDIADDMNARPVDVWRASREFEYGEVRGPKDITDDDLADMVDGGLSPREVAEVLEIKYADGRGQPVQDLIDRMTAIDDIEFPTAWGPFLRLWRDRNPAEIAAIRARASELYYDASGARQSTYEKVAGLLTEETGTRWSATRVSQLLRGDPKVRFSRAQPGDPQPIERGAMRRPTAEPDARRGPATTAPDRAERIRQLVNDPDGDTGPRFELVGKLDDEVTKIRQGIDEAMTKVTDHPIPEYAAEALRTIRGARKDLRRKQFDIQAEARKMRKTVSSRSQDARSRAISNTIEEQVKAIDRLTAMLERLIKNPDYSDRFQSELYRLNPHSGYGAPGGLQSPSFGTPAKPGVTFGEAEQTAQFLGGKEAAWLIELAEDLSQTLGDDLARSTDRGATLSADGKFMAYLNRAISNPADAAEEVAHIASLAELFNAKERRALIAVAKAWRKKQGRDPLAGYDDLSPGDFDEELIAKYLSRSQQRFSSTTTLGRAMDRFHDLVDLMKTAFSKDAKAKILARKFQRGELAKDISEAIRMSRERVGAGESGRAPLVLATRRLRRSVSADAD